MYCNSKKTLLVWLLYQTINNYEEMENDTCNKVDKQEFNILCPSDQIHYILTLISNGI